MNTKEQIDELFFGILEQRQKIDLKRFEIYYLMKIRKVKLQFYFKKKFAELLPQLQKLEKGKTNDLSVFKQAKSSKQNLSKGIIIEMTVAEISEYLKVKEYQLYDLLLRKGILIKSYNDKLSSGEIGRVYRVLNNWYHLLPLEGKEELVKTKKKRSTKRTKKIFPKDKLDESVKEQEFLIDNILNHSIEYIAQFVGQKIDRIIYVLNSNGVSNVNKDSVLSTSDIMLIYDYLNNAFNVYTRKCGKEKEERDYKGITKRIVERYKPSLGLEGDYRRLIYIPTKT